MIYVNMSGRCGNQLFFYAIARRVQELSNRNDKIVFVFSEDCKEGSYGENSLNDFQIKDSITIYEKYKKIVLKNGTLTQKISYLFMQFIKNKLGRNKPQFQANLQLSLNKKGLYLNPHNICRLNDTRIKGSKAKNIFIDGRYENGAWFNSIRDDLLNELQPILPMVQENKNLYTKIDNSESVCISIRRGDYVTNEGNAKVFNICSVEYYKKAIEEIKQRVKDPVFILFSDDIEWAKENISIDGCQVFYETGNDPVWEKLRLMSSCKHFIISNSTFSWWAQYLSKNENKVVVSPNIWFKPNLTWPLIEDSFVKINAIE